MKNKKEVLDLSDIEFIKWCITICPQIRQQIKDIDINILRNSVKKYYNPSFLYFYDVYDKNSEYKEFSNFYKSPISLKIGKETVLCDTVEHCFQAQKFMGPNATKDDLEYAKLIATQSTPNKSFILAKQQKKGGYAWVNILNKYIEEYKAKGVKMRSDWDSDNGAVKIDVMRQLLIKKFENPILKKLLLSTKNKIIHEHTPLGRDHFWGDGGDGSGKSWLGKLLMEIRSSLK